MLKNEDISLEEKIDISYQFSYNIDKNIELLSKIKYLKDNNRLDLINSCPENLLLCVLPGDTNPLINYFNKENLPKIDGPMRNLDIIYKYYESKELSFFYENISRKLLKNKFKDCDTLFEFFLKNSLSDENKLNEFIELINKSYIYDGYRFILAKYNIYLPKKDSKIGFYIEKNIVDFIDENYEKKVYSNDESELVNRFNNLFLDSDKDVVRLAIISFYQTYSFDKERAIRDMMLLIQYKENNSEFKLNIHNSMNCFTKTEIHNPYSNTHLNPGITISKKNAINIFDHELGHFLFETSNIDYINNNISNSICSNSIVDYIYDEVIKIYSSLEKEKEEKYLKYVGNIDQYKNKLRKEFMELYSSNDNNYVENISIFIDNIKVVDKNDLCDFYVNNRIIKEKKIIHDVLFKNKYTNIIAFVSFINDYYKGDFNTKIKVKSNFNFPIATYSPEYFFRKNNAQIHELFANFTLLLRDKNGKKYINYLKKVCSHEFIDYLYKIDNLISNNYLNTKSNKICK